MNLLAVIMLIAGWAGSEQKLVHCVHEGQLRSHVADSVYAGTFGTIIYSNDNRLRIAYPPSTPCIIL